MYPSNMTRCSEEIADDAKEAASAYYKIKDLRKQIKVLKTQLAQKSKNLVADFGDMMIYKKGTQKPKEGEKLISLGGSRFPRKTCERFMKHLAAGDLVKTAETTDNK